MFFLWLPGKKQQDQEQKQQRNCHNRGNDQRFDLHRVRGHTDNLRLCNVFDAADFTTAEYWIFSAMKSLQLNPDVSEIIFRTPLTEEEEISLCSYFRAVEAVWQQ